MHEYIGITPSQIQSTGQQKYENREKKEESCQLLMMMKLQKTVQI